MDTPILETLQYTANRSPSLAQLTYVTEFWFGIALQIETDECMETSCRVDWRGVASRLGETASIERPHRVGRMVGQDGDGTAQPGRGGYPQCAHRDGLFPLLQRCCELWPRTGPRIPGQGPCSLSFAP